MTSFKLISIESTYFQFSNSKLSHSPCHTEGNLCMLKSTKTNAGTTSGPGTRWIWVIQPARQGALTPGCSDQWLEVLGQIYDEVKSTLVNDGFTQRLWNVLMLWFLEGCTHHGQKVVTRQGMISDPWREIPHNEASLQNLIHSENWWCSGLKEWEGCSEYPHLQIIRTKTTFMKSDVNRDFYLYTDCDRRYVFGQVWSMPPSCIPWASTTPRWPPRISDRLAAIILFIRTTFLFMYTDNYIIVWLVMFFPKDFYIFTMVYRRIILCFSRLHVWATFLHFL